MLSIFTTVRSDMAFSYQTSLFLVLFAWQEQSGLSISLTAQTGRHLASFVEGETERDVPQSMDQVDPWFKGHFSPSSAIMYPTDDDISEASGVRANTNGDTRTLAISLIFSSALVLIIVFLSFVLRVFNPVMFHRSIEEVDPDTSLGRYLSIIFGGRLTNPEEFIEVAGLDAWTLVHFYTMVRHILGTIGPAIICALWPLHCFISDASASTDLLSRLDINNMPDGSVFYWAHALVTVFVVVVATALMGQAHDKFLFYRFLWIEALKPPRATTLLVENIPQQYRSDFALRDYFKGLFGDVIEKAYIVRRTSELRAARNVVKAIEYEKTLLMSQWEHEGHPDNKKPDLTELDKQWDEAAMAAERVRAKIELCAAVGDPTVCANSGFVTFKSQLWRRLAENEQYRTDSSEFAVQIPPEASDVIYKDLKKDTANHLSSEAVGTMCIALVFLFWSPVVVLISGFTSLDQVQAHVTWLRELTERSPQLGFFLEGIFATAAMKMFMCFLPYILFFIITNFFTVKAQSWAQLRLERWYVAFLLTFVVLFTIVGRSALIAIVSLAEGPADLFRLLAMSLPGVSHFYLNYLALDWFSTSIQLLRHGNIFNFWFYRFVRWMKPEVAKSFSEPENQAFFGMGARFGHGVLVATIAIVLCTCSPSIILIGWVTMFVGETVYAYLLMTVESKKADTGGRFWIDAMTQLFFCILLYTVLMIGILCRQQMPIPIALSSCSLIVLYRAWERFQNLSWEKLPLEAVAEKAKRERGAAPQQGDYIQEECLPIQRQNAAG